MDRNVDYCWRAGLARRNSVPADRKSPLRLAGTRLAGRYPLPHENGWLGTWTYSLRSSKYGSELRAGERTAILGGGTRTISEGDSNRGPYSGSRVNLSHLSEHHYCGTEAGESCRHEDSKSHTRRC